VLWRRFPKRFDCHRLLQVSERQYTPEGGLSVVDRQMAPRYRFQPRPVCRMAVHCLLDTPPDILDISSTRSRSWSDAVSVDTQPDLDKFDTRADTDKFDNDYVKRSQCSHQTLRHHVRHGTVWANQTISYDTKHGRTRKRQITPQALPIFTPRVPH